MGFSAANIIAPNVPDKFDPLTFLTSTPRSRVQEQAQEQAQALGHALLRGMSVQTIEQIVLGPGPSRRSDLRELTKDEVAGFQSAKTCVIPRQITQSTVPSTVSIDYPYLFVNARSRLAHNYMSITLKGEPSEKMDNFPTIELTADEYANFSAKTIQKYRAQIDEAGVAKFRLASRGSVSLKVPFSQDYTGLKVRNQCLIDKKTNFDYRSIKRGFFRALIRFHTSYGGNPTAETGLNEESKKKRLVRLPMFERRAIDFFRMYQMVELRGGMNEVVRRKEWAQIGRELGYSSSILPTLSTTMRNVYMKVLYPFSQWLKLHAELDVRLVPQLDVIDDAAKLAELGEGWKPLSYGVIVYTRSAKVTPESRQIIDIDVQRTPCLTLRSYRSPSEHDKSGAPPTENHDIKQEFMNLPQFYLTDVVWPNVKLHGFPVNIIPPTPSGIADFGDISTLPFRDGGEKWLKLISEDLDSIIIPELQTGSKFSVVDWDVAPVSAYKVSVIIEGGASTWCIKNSQQTIDQSWGEIVVVPPGVRSMHWRNEQNVSVDCNVLLPQCWLEGALKHGSNASKTVNLERLIYDACIQKMPDADSDLKTQILHGLKMCRDQEKRALNTIGAKYDPITTPPHPYVSESGKRGLFSFIRCDNKIFSPEEFLATEKSLSRNNGIQFCTVYGREVDQYFDDLESKLSISHQQEGQIAWVASVGHALSRTDSLPLESELLTARDCAPELEEPQQHKALKCISQMLENFSNWELLPENEKISKMRTMVEVNDLQTVEPTLNAVISSAKNSALMWNALLAAMDEPRVVDFTFGLAKRFLDDADFMRLLPTVDAESLQKIAKACAWAVCVTTVTRPKVYGDEFVCPDYEPFQAKPKSLNDLIQLRKDGLTLGFNASSPIIQSIGALINNIDDANGTITRHVQIIEALNPIQSNNLLLRYLPIADYLDPEPFDMLRRLVEKSDVLTRMKATDIWKRPRRSEIQNLMDIPAIKFPLAELDTWLSTATQLPWPAIFSQLQMLAANAESPQIVPISCMAIYNQYLQIFNLTVLPDDIEQVVTTFENALEQFRNTPSSLLFKHGFLD